MTVANGRTGGSRTIWYIVGGIIILLILAWLVGLFRGDDDVAVVTEDGAVVTEDGVATGEEAEEGVEDVAD